MSERLAVSVDPGMARAVRIFRGRADAYRCARRDRPGAAGDIYLGRVTRVAPALDAAFVDCGLERDGFLTGADAPGGPGPIERRCHEGQTLAVQALADPPPGKGARLSARLRFVGRFAIHGPDMTGIAVSRRLADSAARHRLSAAAARVLEARSGGAIVRGAAAGAGVEALAADLVRLADEADATARLAARAAPPRLLRAELEPVERLMRDFAPAGATAVVLDEGDAFGRARRYADRFAPDLAGRIERHTGPAPLFEAEGAADDIAALSEPRSPLANGGALTIERTEGMWTIDVDGAGFAARAGGRNVFRLNIDAAQEVARQLRLRDISGLVAVDFAGMAGPRDGAAVVRALRVAAARDDTPVRVAPMSPFGVVELTRRRARPALAEILGEPCPACGGAGRRATAFATACEIVRACLAEAARSPGRRLAVRAAPDALAALDGPLRAAVDAVCAATWRAEADWPRARFEVRAHEGP